MPSKIIKPPDICLSIGLYYESNDVLNPLYSDESVKIHMRNGDHTSLKKLIRVSISLTTNIPVTNLTSDEIQKRIVDVQKDSSIKTLTNLIVEIYDFMENSFQDAFPKVKILQKPITSSWINDSVIYKSNFYYNGISDKIVSHEYELFFLTFINRFFELGYTSNLIVNASFYNYSYLINDNMPVNKSSLLLFLKQRQRQLQKLLQLEEENINSDIETIN